MSTVHGRVVLRESGEGLAGLLVSLYATTERMPPARAGSVLTADDGSFAMAYEVTAPSAGRSPAAPPSLTLVVSAADAGLEGRDPNAGSLAWATRPAGSDEAFIFQVDTDQLGAAGLQPPLAGGVRSGTLDPAVALDRAREAAQVLEEAGRRRVVEDLRSAVALHRAARDRLPAFLDALIPPAPADGRRVVARGASVRDAAAEALAAGIEAMHTARAVGRLAVTDEQRVLIEKMTNELTEEVDAKLVESLLRPQARHSATSVTRLDPRAMTEVGAFDGDGLVDLTDGARNDDRADLPPDVDLAAPAAWTEAHHLRLAHDPVWQEVIDHTVIERAEEVCRLLLALGEDPVAYAVELPVARAATTRANGTPPASVAAAFDVVPEQWDALAPGHPELLEDLAERLAREQVGEVADALRRSGQRLLAAAGRAAASPDASDQLHEGLEALREGLDQSPTSVLHAAGSVTFGVLLTYRQTWTPVGHHALAGEVVAQLAAGPTPMSTSSALAHDPAATSDAVKQALRAAGLAAAQGAARSGFGDVTAFRVDEHLHRVTPVVLVAQEIPATIDGRWITANEWVLRGALLDPSLDAAFGDPGQTERLVLHIRANLTHYLQAVWRAEPADQRRARLGATPVPVVQGRKSYTVAEDADGVPSPPAWTVPLKLSMRCRIDAKVGWQPLERAADLDTLLGFDGNSAIFPLRRSNVICDFVMLPYLDAALGVHDPDRSSPMSASELDACAARLAQRLPGHEIDLLRPALMAATTRAKLEGDGEVVVLPTGARLVTPVLKAATSRASTERLVSQPT